MKYINILGCCILRDILRIADVNQEYKVNKFYQFVNPVSIVEKPPRSPRMTPEELEMFEWANFIRKNVCSDFNKDVISVYAENANDFLLIDLCELRFKNVAVKLKDGQRFYLTKQKYTNLILQNIEKFSIFDGAEIEDPAPLEDDAILEYLREYMSALTKIYPKKNIIMVRNLGYYKGIDEDLKCFFEYNHRNSLASRARLNKFYDYVEQICPDINVIRMPDNCLCYAQHLWGKDPLHFYDEYYIYLYKSMELICNNAPDAKERIEQLRIMYSDHFKLLEEKKRLEFIVEKQEQKPNPLQSPDFSDMSKWKLACSKQSKLEADNVLVCDSENGEACWAILSQELDPATIANKEVTLSVKYEAYDDSLINVCIRTRSDAGDYSYLLFNQFTSDKTATVSSVTGVLPKKGELKDAHVLVYLNKANSKAKILNVKLEFGGSPSLY